MIGVSEGFRGFFPGARVGILTMTGVSNPPGAPVLDRRKTEIEQALRKQFGGWDRERLKQLPVLRAYDEHYRKFDKVYHLLAQLESVAVKSKPIPAVAAVVEAMFMAELKNLLLTAGHDLAGLKPPLTLDVAAGGESYLGIRGRTESCKAGDMMIADGEGVVSSVLCGPDSRTRITPQTTAVLFTVYAPAGVTDEAVRLHLQDIEEFVRLSSPSAATGIMELTPSTSTGVL
jgi:DNA/RNA-binding domain of Phe-tRNA-synthetase-like protein